FSLIENLGSKNGNRRTANVRSLGYSDLYTLRKEDLWLVLDNYPESLSKIIEQGKLLLRKDKLLDESLNDSKRYVEQDQLLSIQNRIKKLIDYDESLNECITTFLDTYVDSITIFKQKLSRLEYRYGARKPSLCVPNIQLSVPSLPFFVNQWKQYSSIQIPK